MRLEIKVDESFTEPRIVIMTNEITEEINDIVKRLSEESFDTLAGFRNGSLEPLWQQDILRIYTESGKVLAETKNGTYTLRLRLYELNDRLNKKLFVRISKSEIINLKWVKNFDLSLAGTICVTFKTGTKAYVSRRYVPGIKRVLGL